MDWLNSILTAANITVPDEVMTQIENAFKEQTAGLGDLSALQAQYNKDTGALKEQLSALQLASAIDLALAKSGAKNAKAVKALLDENKLAFKDGSVEGLDEQLAQIKADNDYLFEQRTATGIPHGSSGTAADGVEAKFYEMNPNLKK